MRGFFSLDGTFYKFGSILADIFMVSFLWLVFSIPIITIGASTSAAYYVFTKRVDGKDSYIIKGFISSFVKNLKQNIIITIILFAISYVLWLNFQLLDYSNLGNLTFVVQLGLTFVSFQLILMTMYIFPIIARFESTIKDAMKTSLKIANKHLFFTISNFIMLLAIIILIELVPFLIIFIIGIYIYLSSFGFVRLFKKYNEKF